MPKDIVETFARSLIDQIVLQAFDEVKTQPETEMSQTHTQQSNMYMGYGKTEETEVLERMVPDLRDVQIGDSHFVYSPSMSRFDRQQVRRPACSLDNALIDNSSDVAEMSGIQGQGDVESIAHDAESEKSKGTESTTNSYRREREQLGTNDATKMSINVLHRMIEELETVNEDPNDTNYINKPDERSKEEIATWEEKEEELILIIEGTEGSLENINQESRSIRHLADENKEELKSSMLISGASTSRNLSFDEVYIEESTFDCPPRQTSTTDEIGESQVFSEGTIESEQKETKAERNKKMKKKEGKKESLGRRLKRFFLRSFKREKN